MNQNEQMCEDIDSDIQAAYDFMNAVVDQSTRARHELEHWKTEHGKLSHECARLMLVIASLKEKALAAEPAKLVRLTEEEIIQAWDSHIVPVFGKTGINVIVFANAIMDALEAKNGGKV